MYLTNIDNHVFERGAFPVIEYAGPQGSKRNISIHAISMFFNGETRNNAYEFLAVAQGPRSRGDEFRANVTVMIEVDGDPEISASERISAHELAHLTGAVIEHANELCGLAVANLSTYDKLREWARNRNQRGA